MKVCTECGRCYDDSVNFCTEGNHQDLSRLRAGGPDMIPGYRLDYLLESGVRGESYRAHQTQCGRACLIRVLSADKTNIDQFSSDARLAAAFFHPNIIDVYESGSLPDGELFVVAEDAGGKDLRGFLNTVGVPELLTSIEIIRQTAEALDALHREGLVHRAVNPENIILTTDTSGRLLVRIQNPDFGGVVQTSIVSNKFLIDSALDSLRYFAPEQCSGGDATPQTDVYSLGVVFYEMLAGNPPFDASKAVALIEKHRNERPPDVKIANFNLRMLVTHALSESLQKQPKLRQQSANALARQLRHIEQLANHVSTPPPAGVVPEPPVRTSPHVNIYEAELKRPVIQPIVKKSWSKRKDKNRRATDMPTIVVTEAVVPVVAEHTPLADEVVAQGSGVIAPVEVHESSGNVRSRLSRLKLHMKTWRSKLEPHEAEIREGSITIVEPHDTTPEIAPVQIQTAASVVTIEEHPAVEPTKIEWEPLEDDIPTIEDVLEVIAKEHIESSLPIIETDVESVEEEVSVAMAEPEAVQELIEVEEEVSIVRAEPVEVIEAVSVEPTIVEEVKAEDEISLLSDAIAVEDGIPVIQIDSEILPETAEAVEEEDIPVIHVEGESVPAVPVLEPMKVEEEIPVIRVEEEIPVIQVEGETVEAASVKIEDKIPAVEVELEPVVPATPTADPVEMKLPAVRRKRKRSVREMPVVAEQPVVERVEVKNEIAPVAKVTPTTPETTIPIGRMKLEDLPVVRENKPAKPVASENDVRIPWVKGVFKPIKEIERIPVVRDELEEITLVRVPRPIKIDVPAPARSYDERRDKMFAFDTQDAVRFVPTLLGDTEKRRTIELDPKDAMFASLGNQRTIPVRLRRRLIAAGGVSVLLVVGFLFGADLGRYLQAAGSEESAATSSPGPAPVATLAKVAVPKPEKVKSVAVSQPAEKESKASTAKEKATSAVEKASTPTVRSAKVSEKSKPKEAEATKRPVEKKPAPVEKKPTPPAKKTSGGTRARIVSEPQR